MPAADAETPGANDRRTLTRRQVLAAGAAGGGLAALGPLASRTLAASEPGTAAAPADIPPPQELVSVNILPPGESGLFPILDQVVYGIEKNPAAFGPHVDDQRGMYWNFQYKPAGFETPAGTPMRPLPGVRIYRGAYGVPLIYGDDTHSLWYGAGYAAAQDRLFQIDALRRTARGTLAELAGPAALPGDVQTRVVSYTDDEYDQMFDTLLTAEDQAAVDGSIAGVNAWIESILLHPTDLPGEYTVLATLPAPLSRRDLMAIGVYMARNIASAGGGEFGNIANLHALEAQHGNADGRGIFNDLFWVQDDRAYTTIPASEGTFANGTVPANPVNGFDYVGTLPMELAQGPGTGAFPVPTPLDSVSQLVQSLLDWRKNLHGGSYQFALAPSRTATGQPMLVNGPQLGYAYPSELYEIEVHGAGYDARGVTVAGVPLVGIGHGKRIAWGLTTGLSKTIDSFIETTRPNPVPGGPPQYLHNGSWVDEEVRTETFHYRTAESGIPVGPAVFSTEVRVGRTVHGPIVSATADGKLACSVQYAMWMREVSTLSGILSWNRADNLDEFAAGVAKVTWNENTLYADADGNIAYWHPGLYPVRSPEVDLRFPTPGTGAFDWIGLLPFSEMPHVVNPPQGYLCNWNTKPAVGWLFGSGDSPPEQPAGFASRTQDIADQLAARTNFQLVDLITVDKTLGLKDHRARDFLPLLLTLRAATDLSAQEAAALTLLSTWDGTTTIGPTDGPAATVFGEVMSALVTGVLGPAVPAALIANLASVGGHLFDVTPIYNVVLKALFPATSGNRVAFDYLAGRTVTEVLQAALGSALAALEATYRTSNLAAYRRPHPTAPIASLTGVVGPTVEMPFLDRGTFIHLVALTG